MVTLKTIKLLYNQTSLGLVTMNINQSTIKKDLKQAPFSQQPKYYVQHLSQGFKQILNYYASYTNRKIKHIFPTIETIALESGVCPNTVIAANKYFEEIGILIKLKTSRRSNEYILHPYFYISKFRYWASTILTSLRNKIVEILASYKSFYYTQRSISNRAFNFYGNIGVYLNTGVFKKEENNIHILNNNVIVNKHSNVVLGLIGGMEERRGKTNKDSPPVTNDRYKQKEELERQARQLLRKEKERENVCPDCKNFMERMVLQTMNSNNFPDFQITWSCLVCPNLKNKPNPFPTS